MIKINPKYLPSRKFITYLSIAVAIAIVVSSISFLNNIKYEAKNNNKIEIKNINSFDDFKLVDSDSDGVLDWQETLYGTDPKKEDSDLDGATDGEEMTLNRDPLKANTAQEGQEPNDKIDSKIIAQEQKIEDEYSKLNDTQKFSRFFLSNYLANQPLDRELTQAEIEEIVNQMINYIPNTTQSDKYSEDDIKINREYNKEFLTKYNKEISDIIVKEIVPTMTNGIEMSSYLIQTEKFSDLYKITPISNKLVLISQKITNTEVPEIVWIDHLALANEVYKLSEILKKIQSIDTDALQAMLGLRDLTKIIEEMNVTINEISSNTM